MFAYISKYNQNSRNFHKENTLKKTLLNYIGNTPLVELTDLPFLDFDGIRLFAKLEMYNFSGSIKDRPVLWMINKAERSGILDSSKILVEPTSGNTGISLAWIGSLKGYRVIIVMPETMTIERRAIIRSYGAEIVLTKGNKGIDGSIQKAQGLLLNNSKYAMLDQFSNHSNVESHYHTTGPEIWKQTNGKIDYLFAGIGTAGTITGTGLFLKSKNPTLSIIGVEPTIQAPIPGLKNLKINKIPKIFQADLFDQRIYVSYEEAVSMSKLLASEASLLMGLSSGAVLTGIIKYATENKKELQGKNIVTIFPDGGVKYLSQGFF